MKPNKKKYKSLRDKSDAQHLESLSNALDNVADRNPEGLIKRGLLPSTVVGNLDFAHFLCNAVLPARKAARATGVPASLLIAEARMDGMWERPLIGLAAYFLDLAQALATEPSLMAAARNPAALLEEILKCKAWDPQHRADLAEMLIVYHLHECDWTTLRKRSQGQAHRTTLSYKERLALAMGHNSGGVARVARMIRKKTGVPSGLAKKTAECMIVQLAREGALDRPIDMKKGKGGGR